MSPLNAPDPDLLQQEEIAKGRVALWLDPSDIEWLAGHCGCAPDADDETRDRCARIRFRSNTALHKAGFKNQ